MQNKISKLIQTPQELKALAENNSQQKLIVTNGCFDILHIGHIRYLQQAQLLGDKLLIGLNSDHSIQKIKGPSRPINNQLIRAEMLAALACVDYIYIFDEDTADNLLMLSKPSLYTKGGDYNLDNLPEKDTLQKINCQFKSLNFHQGHSTTNIIEKIQNN